MSSQKPNREVKRPRVIVNGQEIDLGSQMIMPEVKRRRGLPCGCIFVTLLIVVPLIFAGAAIYSAFVGFSSDNPFGQFFSSMIGVTAPEMVAITGDASRFDPLVGLAQAQALAGEDAQLAAISAYYVRSDGTMDLNATYRPAPYTDYKFLRPIERPADAPPVGVSGSTNGQWYVPIEVSAYEPG